LNTEKPSDFYELPLRIEDNLHEDTVSVFTVAAMWVPQAIAYHE